MTRRVRSNRALMVGVLLPAALAVAAVGGGALGVAFGADVVDGRMTSPHSFVAARPASAPPQDRFQHAKHAKVFPLCSTCHAGVTDAQQPTWPNASQCVACHDGVVEARVTWAPRTGPRAGNLRFTHEAHSRAVMAKNPADSAVTSNCAACHNERGAPRMAVRNAVVAQCLDCHGLRTPHFDSPSEACATCHVPLAQAPGLTTEDIARFPKPRSHEAPGFASGGHGKEAKGPGKPGTPEAVAASCATCHARNFCVACHVNAPEVPEIQALAVDGRLPAFAATVAAPPSHATPAFLRTHGRDAQRTTATCAACHARESCTSCHMGLEPSRAIAAMPAAGPGRAPGVRTEREPPPSHTREFMTDRHGPDASARPATCETCHVRATCLECHRPIGEQRSVARQSSQVPTNGTSQPNGQSQAQAPGRMEAARRSGFHPASFLTRHPSSAYAREANCSDCHNPAQFCQSCHQQSGLVANSRIGSSGYHDAYRGFSLGHGQAARQSLETCVSCHAERDCTACHSAVGGGFRFKPHGPGFNASRAKSKNPSLCVACHGTAIPGGG